MYVYTSIVVVIVMVYTHFAVMPREMDIVVGGEETIETGPDNLCNYTKSIRSRKRIYGEEYRSVGGFCEPPRAKNLKLDRPEFERAESQPQQHQQPQPQFGLTAEVQRSTATTSQRFVPTGTQRPYIKVSLDLHNIAHICENCYGLSCFCSI